MSEQAGFLLPSRYLEWSKAEGGKAGVGGCSSKSRSAWSFPRFPTFFPELKWGEFPPPPQLCLYMVFACQNSEPCLMVGFVGLLPHLLVSLAPQYGELNVFYLR